MRLSIVTTLYRSARELPAFIARACAAAERLTSDYELVLVDDGSPDESLAIAVELCARRRSKVIKLSRNFGHHQAIMTGLAHADGDMVFLLDSDLEEAPELLEAFHDRLHATGASVVYGVQEIRKGRLFERVTGSLFYSAFNALSRSPVPANLVIARLMLRPYVDALLTHEEREIFIGGLWSITGFTQVAHPVRKSSRGTTTYTLKRKVALFVNSVTSFSDKPLVFVFYLGVAIVVASGAAALVLIARKVFFHALLIGWPSLIVSIWLLGGLTIFCVGVLGIYLSKIFLEVKRRPLTIVERIYVGSPEPHAARPAD